MIPEEPLQVLIQDLGLSMPQIELSALQGGFNNRVFRVDGPERSYLLKHYYAHQSDFPRLRQEFAFSQYLADQCPGRSPIPYAQNPEAGLAIYEWIEGQPYQKSEIAETDLQAAVDFILTMQSHAARALALPAASESCWDLRDHVNHLEQRLERLQIIEAHTATHQEALHWIQMVLLPLASHCIAEVRSTLETTSELNRRLRPEERWLSPSDFGFHNALRTSKGPVFLDFEYAGWDDLAQLLSDFYAQFEVPPPRASFERVASHLVQQTQEPDWHLQRLKCIFPIHILKWCCIALNHFCATKSANRDFANKGEQLNAQLIKAKQVLQPLI